MCRRDDFPPHGTPDAGALCRCDHPYAEHDATDDEPGPCHHDPSRCGCDAFAPWPDDPSDDLMEARYAGPSLDQTHAAAWRQHEEAHR